jgi:hypothetical protein
MNKTVEAIFHWPNMKSEIEDYVRKCKSCQTNKMLDPKNRVPMEIATTADHPFERCSLDIVGPLPETEKGNRYILTDLSKLVTAVPLPQQDADTVAREFVAKCYSENGYNQASVNRSGNKFLERHVHKCVHALKNKENTNCRIQARIEWRAGKKPPSLIGVFAALCQQRLEELG